MKIQLLILASLLTTNSFAAATTPLKVTSTLNSACTIKATDMPFGVFVPKSTGVIYSTSSLTILCSNSKFYRFGLEGEYDRVLNG